MDVQPLTDGAVHMEAATDFLLERVVHQILKGEGGRGIVQGAFDAGMSATSMIADTLWPAMECVQQLHQDETIGARIHNTALRALRSLLEVTATQLPREREIGRSMFVLAAPGERVELGAHMVATLAESQGWQVFFAGAGLSLEEVTFSIGQLSPDAIVMHGSVVESRERVGQFVRQLQRIRVWPNVQLVVIGGVVEGAGAACPADLLGRHPMEALELMALWPEYRAKGSGGKSLKMMEETWAISPGMIQKMVARHFGEGLHRN